jgi:hypothetical protein
MGSSRWRNTVCKQPVFVVRGLCGGSDGPVGLIIFFYFSYFLTSAASTPPTPFFNVLLHVLLVVLQISCVRYY